MINKLEKFTIHFILAILLVSCISMCQNCSTKRELAATQKENKMLNNKLDTFMNYTTDIKMEIYNLKLEKSVLLSTNQIFLTKERPDARVIEIDDQIKKLERGIK